MPLKATSELSPQACKSTDSTNAILRAAIELIAAEGAKASIMSIAQRSGFSHGLVMARFGSKAGLIRAVTREVQVRFQKRVAAGHGGAGGIAALKATVNAVFSDDQSDPIGGAFFVLLGEAVGPDKTIRKAFVKADQAYRTYIERMIMEAQSRAEIDKKVNPAALSALIVGMLRGVLFQTKVNPDGLDRKATRLETLALLERLRPVSAETAAPVKRRAARK